MLIIMIFLIIGLIIEEFKLTVDLAPTRLDSQ